MESIKRTMASFDETELAESLSQDLVSAGQQVFDALLTSIVGRTSFLLKAEKLSEKLQMPKPRVSVSPRSISRRRLR